MKRSEARAILFNVAAGVITIAALVAVVRSFLVRPATAPCSERYAAGTFFSLERGGVLLTSTDLQARLAGKDVGLGDNVEIARVKGGPAPVALGVRLAKGSASPHAPEATRGGLSFPWEPRAMQGKSAACLAYSVLLPADFDFHRGGLLPGILGGEESEVSHDAFAAPFAWRRNGRGGVTTRVLQAGEARSGPVETEPFILPAGRWVSLQQEVVLNTPGKSDGVMRVWVDGRLVLERGNLAYRVRPQVAVTGVAADVYYGTEDAATGAPKDTTIWVSPFEIRWQ